MMKQKSLVVGLSMLILLIAVMVVGPHLPFIDKELKEETLRLEGGISSAPFPPSLSEPFEPFGTDMQGRDILSLIVLGTVETIFLVIFIAVIRYAVAIPLAFAAIRKQGPFHWILNTWNNVFSAIPTIFSAIILMSIPFFRITEHRALFVIFILALIEVGRVSYIIQQEGYLVSNELYVQAGITVGNSRLQLFQNYYLPALLPSLCTNFFMDLGRVMLLIGQLGVFSIFIEQSWIQLSTFSGEVQNISYNWASILGETRTTIRKAPWITFFPALAITFTIMSFFFIGEGLRSHFSRR